MTSTKRNILFSAMWACSLLGLSACLDSSAESRPNAEVAKVSETKVDVAIPVKVTSVEMGTFTLKVFTNGVIQANQMVEVKMRSTGRVVVMPLKEGMYAKKGALMAQQEKEELQLQLAQKQEALQQTIIKLNELLILQGGEAHDTASVSWEILKTLRSTSGYNAVLQEINLIKYQIAQTTLRAPYSGLVSTVLIKPWQEALTGEVLCTLIDPGSYEVLFTVLEKDMATLHYGQQISYTPIAIPDRTYKAVVTKIDPIVDGHGLVKVMARLKGTKKGLFSGMKVRVAMEQKQRDQLIVPKSALVIRSNRSVIFVADTTNHLAKWKYVEVANENDQHLAIASGLEATDLVIYEGNLNLAHDASIAIDKEPR